MKVLFISLILFSLTPGILFSQADPRSTASTGASVGPKLKGFLNQLFTSQEDLHAAGLRTRTAYAKVAELVRDGKDEEAIAAFGEYFTDKLRNPQKYGISRTNLDPYISGISGYGRWQEAVFDPNQNLEKVKAAADALMQGKVGTGEKAVVIGEPGNVNWLAPFNSMNEIRGRDIPLQGLTNGNAFRPLAEAYVLTRDERYLKRWEAYLQDWVDNANYVDGLHPLQIPDAVHSSLGSGAIGLTRTLAGLARVPKADGGASLDPRLLAGIIHKILTVQLLPGVAYIRSNTHNWTPGAAPLLLATIYDEFKTSPLLFHEGMRRQIEDNAVTQNLRDGTENQQDPWYNDNYLQIVSAIGLLDERRALLPYDDSFWLKQYRDDVGWRSEIRDHLREHVNYMIHLRTAQNEWPIPFRGGDKRAANRPEFVVSPEAFADPVNRSILEAVDSPGNIANPPYNSEWFPYAGFNVIRKGWGKQDAYGAMFCSPVPGAYGAFRSRSNNNSFGLAAFGQDLLIDDTTGHYMYPSSPIQVDGKNQFFHEGVYKVGRPEDHKVYQVSAWTEPSPWRWHESQNFNLMEGVYKGPFGNPEIPTPATVGAYGAEESEQGAPKKNAMTRDVAHQRLVLFDRSSDIWIVADRMATTSAHEFTQQWMIPISPAANAAFKPEEISIDEKKKVIRTECDEFVAAKENAKAEPKANITLQQISAERLTYARKSVPGRQLQDGRILTYGWEEIRATWKANGPHQIITAILPRSPGSKDDFKAVEELAGGNGVLGFRAKSANDKVVEFLASPSGPAELRLGAITAKAEVLLVSGLRGIALGCKTFAVNGRVTPTAEDFEFDFTGGQLSGVKIYRPISPVKIGPESNVFVDKQTITMSSDTPGVEIRYTLDGSEPTPQSNLYASPFSISQSTRIKARAYRPGLKENPPQTSGTHATATSLAVFSKKTLAEPVTVRKTLPGLVARYYEGDWKTLWLQLNSLQPRATSDTASLWDLSFVPADNPPTGKNPAPRQKFYAVEYSGFIEIPKEGVYDFEAPREVVFPDVDPGYELKFELGNREIPFGPRMTKYGLNEWYPSTRLHAQGKWSIPLKAGKYPIRVTFIDYRTDMLPNLNIAGFKNYIWSGSTPEIRVSGPELLSQPIPQAWLLREDK